LNDAREESLLRIIADVGTKPIDNATVMAAVGAHGHPWGRHVVFEGQEDVVEGGVK
jgi:hypothetical protein